MSDQEFRESVLQRLSAIETSIKGIDAGMIQRVGSVERGLGKVWWVIAVVFTSLIGAFVGHIIRQ